MLSDNDTVKVDCKDVIYVCIWGTVLSFVALHRLLLVDTSADRGMDDVTSNFSILIMINIINMLKPIKADQSNVTSGL